MAETASDIFSFKSSLALFRSINCCNTAFCRLCVLLQLCAVVYCEYFFTVSGSLFCHLCLRLSAAAGNTRGAPYICVGAVALN